MRERFRWTQLYQERKTSVGSNVPKRGVKASKPRSSSLNRLPHSGRESGIGTPVRHGSVPPSASPFRREAWGPSPSTSTSTPHSPFPANRSHHSSLSSTRRSSTISAANFSLSHPPMPRRPLLSLSSSYASTRSSPIKPSEKSQSSLTVSHSLLTLTHPMCPDDEGLDKRVRARSRIHSRAHASTHST